MTVTVLYRSELSSLFVCCVGLRERVCGKPTSDNGRVRSAIYSSCDDVWATMYISPSFGVPGHQLRLHGCTPPYLPAYLPACLPTLNRLLCGQRYSSPLSVLSA